MRMLSVVRLVALVMRGTIGNAVTMSRPAVHAEGDDSAFEESDPQAIEHELLFNEFVRIRENIVRGHAQAFIGDDRIATLLAQPQVYVDAGDRDRF